MHITDKAIQLWFSYFSTRYIIRRTTFVIVCSEIFFNKSLHRIETSQLISLSSIIVSLGHFLGFDGVNGKLNDVSTFCEFCVNKTCIGLKLMYKQIFKLCKIDIYFLITPIKLRPLNNVIVDTVMLQENLKTNVGFILLAINYCSQRSHSSGLYSQSWILNRKIVLTKI